ncbi:hypothetical protein SISSUDRAFT_1044364 [Sistotremastrum suecicum HHB10207 ss-3]|uniref:Uncharacterized protein n=1 Tax=Sistotremastrum suecicum HHB10207 ss-3 TaxID=1314776 RepID=A0A166F9Z0_9AGAM|nr:hypothetical protein SISSUDRAFT_1044364 [Sistotremastrum suecicum HHB10207 ss-3]
MSRSIYNIIGAVGALGLYSTNTVYTTAHRPPLTPHQKMSHTRRSKKIEKDRNKECLTYIRQRRLALQGTKRYTPGLSLPSNIR